jgi:hypothetical protein
VGGQEPARLTGHPAASLRVGNRLHPDVELHSPPPWLCEPLCQRFPRGRVLEVNRIGRTPATAYRVPVSAELCLELRAGSIRDHVVKRQARVVGARPRSGHGIRVPARQPRLVEAGLLSHRAVSACDGAAQLGAETGRPLPDDGVQGAQERAQKRRRIGTT